MNIPTIETRVLERLRFTSFTRLSLHSLMRVPEMRFDSFVDHAAGHLTVRLEAELLGEQREVKISYPTDWWQGVKAALYPWLDCHYNGLGRHCARRWPVRMTVHHIQAQRLYTDRPLPEPHIDRVKVYTANSVGYDRYA